MKHKTSIDGSPAQAGIERCDNRGCLLCSPWYSGFVAAWVCGNPFADLEPAPLWVPRGRNE